HAAWWYDPRARPLWPARRPPFCAARRAVRLDVGGVDGHGTPDAVVTGQGLEHAEPDALPAPAVEAVVDRRVRTVLGRAVPPARPTPEHMHDARDHPAIIDSMRSLATTW